MKKQRAKCGATSVDSLKQVKQNKDFPRFFESSIHYIQYPIHNLIISNKI